MAHLTNFSFECFYKIFTEDASLPLLYHNAKKVKNDQKLKSRGPEGQDPLEAILVIFGRRALIFLFESSWKNIKNDSTFARMRSGDHLGDAKMSKMGTSLRRI